jgi:hypothetical protein
MKTSISTGIIVTVEQIPILRDIIVAHNLDVFIRDTQDTQLLDEQWKPWVRRVRPQLLHCPANIWLYTPSYAWPELQSHHRIRTIIAEQLQQCIQMAKLLGTTGLVIPLEHVYSPLHDRIAYYLHTIETQLRANDLQMMVHAADAVTFDEICAFFNNASFSTRVIMHSDALATAAAPPDHAHWYEEIAVNDEDTIHEATWISHRIIGAHEHASAIRKKVVWAINTLPHIDARDVAQDDADTFEQRADEQDQIVSDSPVSDSDDKIT